MATSLEGCDRSIGFSRAFYFLPFLFLLLPFSLSLSFRVSSLFYLFISSLPFFPTSFNLLWSTFLRASFFFLFFSSFPFFFVSIGNVYFVACTHTRASQRVSINPIFFGSFPSSSVIINAMIIDCDLYVHANFQCCTVLYMLGEKNPFNAIWFFSSSFHTWDRYGILWEFFERRGCRFDFSYLWELLRYDLEYLGVFLWNWFY